MDKTFSLPKEKIRILLLEGIHSKAAELFAAQGYLEVTTLKTALEGSALIEALKGVHMVGIRSRTQLTSSVIKASDRLMAIGCFCIGTNQVDLDAARHTGVPVFNAPFSNTRSVAELVMGEIIMLLRRIPSRSEECHAGGWDKSALNAWEVRGKTLGIVGYGSIGSQLSVLAESFGMSVIFYDAIDKLPHGNARAVTSLEDVLRHADVISLHVPQTEQTAGMIGADEIRMMKNNAILINNARGTIVDLEALAGALKTGHLMGAAIDVFPKEPKGKKEPFVSPLQGRANVILTPHIGGSTMEAQERIGVEVAKRLIDYSDVGSTLGAVNFPAVQLPARPVGSRFMHVHENRPGIMRQINEIFSSVDINIVGQYLQTDGGLGYVVVETDARPDQALDTLILKQLRALDGTRRARLIYRK